MVQWFLFDPLTVSSGSSSVSGNLNGQVQDKHGRGSNDFCSPDVLSLGDSEEVLSDCMGVELPVEIGRIASLECGKTETKPVVQVYVFGVRLGLL